MFNLTCFFLSVSILSVVSVMARGFKVLLRKNRHTLCVIITIPANQIVVSQTFSLLIEVLMGGGGERLANMEFIKFNVVITKM